MIKKIMAGGQTGVERAALDAAIELDIPHGGWVPGEAAADTSTLPKGYELKIAARQNSGQTLEKNITDSDGTLVISQGLANLQLEFARELAAARQRPLLHIDLAQISGFRAAQAVAAWIQEFQVEILHVTGATDAHEAPLYARTLDLLQAAVYLTLTGTGTDSGPGGFVRAPRSRSPGGDWPQTVSDAIMKLNEEMSLRDRVTLANMSPGELKSLQLTLGRYIRDAYGLLSGNDALMRSCRFVARTKELNEHQAAAVIIEKLWARLASTHKLKRLK